MDSETAQARPSGAAVAAKARAQDVQTQLLHRHSAGGNQMVLRLLESARSGTAPPGDDLAQQLRARSGDELNENIAAPPVRTKFAVSQPGDPSEREAEAVASRVVGRAMPRTPAVPGPPVTRLARQAGTPTKAEAADSGLPPGLGAVETVLASSSGEQAMSTAVRERIEPHVGIDLSGVRVRQDAGTDAAAKALNARAFTTGSTIFLAANESPTDLRLMAHEATHVAQQTGPDVHPMIMRDVSVTDVIPDFILDGVRDAVTAIPGYTLLTLIIGTDPLTDRPVQAQREELVEKLLTYGPFGSAVAQVLRSIDVIGDVFTLICDGFAAHNLTLTRIGNDIDAAWEELSVTNGIDGNVAIVRRYVDAILGDVAAFVRSIVDRVIEIVRSVVAEVAEPFLQRPEVKPVWDLARKVLHYDPLRGEDVDAPTVEILADFLRLIGQEQRLAQMTERGTLQQTADWLDTQFATFASIVGDLGALFSDAWEAISPQNLPNLLDTLPPLADRAIALVRRIADFASTVIGKVLELVKQSLLGWLSEHAHSIPGFHLLTVILGRNPFTGESVPRTAENLIRGFITLMPNGEATYAQLAETGVIGEAAARIESEMSRLGISWELITNTFLGIWNTLSLDDLLAPLAAFERVLAQFREPIGRIVEFVTVVVEAVITLVLKLMNFPSDLLGSIINNAKAAIDDIERDPVAFLINMLAALKGGFVAFFDNIATFLLQGLTSWLFRGLNAIGITAPPDLSLQSILDLVLQVLGVTIDHLWRKLAKHLGPDRVAMIRGAIDKLTGAWAFIREVQEQGISAVWRYVVDKLGNLWDSLLGMARDWIMGEIVERVIAKLVSMLDPTGVMAVVNSFIAFFNAIQSAIEYLRDILGIVNEYVTTFAQVAAGNIGPGAEKIKDGLGHAIPIAIGFLANQVGIGNVPEKVVEIIGGLRELIDQALEWLVEQAVQLGQAALSALGIGGREETPAEPPATDTQPTGPDTRTPEQQLAALQAAATEAQQAAQLAPNAAARTQAIQEIKTRHNITTLEIIVEADAGQGERVHIHATVNPTWDGQGFLLDRTEPPGDDVRIIMNMASPPGRLGMERVLAPPGQIGLPAGQWVRAHLVGQGFGQESPHGIFYAPVTFNGRIQNDNIEAAIRGLYAQRKVAAAEFQLTCEAEPHASLPGPRLARVTYNLDARLPGGRWVDLLDAEVSIPDVVTPTPQPSAGRIEIEFRNCDEMSDYENARLGINA